MHQFDFLKSPAKITCQFLISVFLVFSLQSLHLSQQARASTTAKKLKVIVSFSILEDLVQQMGQDQVEVVSIINRMGDPHDFEPRTKHLLLLKDADLFLYNGLGFEPWVDLFLKQSELNKMILNLSVALKLGPADQNPHVWQNPQHLISYVQQIQEALILLQPESQTVFVKNGQKLINEIQNLQKQFQDEFKQQNKDQKKIPTLVTPHNGFYHLSKAYNLNYFPLAANEHHENLSAKSLKQMIDQIKKMDLVFLYDEWQINSALLNTIQSELKIKKTGTLLSDSLTLKSGPGFNIQNFLKYNQQQILKMVSEKSPKE